MNRPKILIIGAGMVGSSSAASIAGRRLGEVFLYDVDEGLCLGRAMDINHSLPTQGSDSYTTGCSRLEDAGPADIIVITAGLARKAGMTRLDLLKHNAAVIGSLAPQLASGSPEARVLLITNPADVLTWHLKNICPDMRIFGLGCSLDMVRLRLSIAQTARISVDNVAAMVIGTHDDNMIPLMSHATISGIPLVRLLSTHEIEKISTMTRTAGSTIVNLMKSHSGHYAAGEVIAQIVESMAMDRGMIFPLSTCLKGEYGYHDTCLALPCVVDNTGVRKVIELDLNDQERASLETCARTMKDQISSLKDLLLP
jgi:malate dehydrogenase